MKKVSLNAPCPCKSGKKYKKCCFLTRKTGVKKEKISAPTLSSGFKEDQPSLPEISPVVEKEQPSSPEISPVVKKEQPSSRTISPIERLGPVNMAPLNIPEQKPKLNKETAEALYKMMINWRNYFLDKKPHIKEYKKIRKLHGEVLQSMMQYYDDGKFEQKIDSDYKSPHSKVEPKSERVLGLIDIKFDFNTDIGNQAFVNYVVYKNAPNLNCITEEFISKNRYRKPEKIDFLYSMLNAAAGLSKITSVDKNEGYAFLEDVFTGAQYKIVDIGLSGADNYDDIYLYTRIITYNGISFNSGLSLIFKKNDSFIKQFIKEEKSKYKPEGELVRFMKLYNHFAKQNRKIGVVKNFL